MTDLLIDWADGRGDLVLANGDLVIDAGLGTAAVASVFSDGLAPFDPAKPFLKQDRRGWWPDTIVDDAYGSTLWRLERSKITTATLRAAETAFVESLQWMKDEGIASKITATAVVVGRSKISIQANIVRGATKRWGELWASTIGLRVGDDESLLALDFT